MNNRFNTFSSYDNNLTATKGDRTITHQENSKNLHKGEEICKDSKNINEMINKQLIKTLNSTSTIQGNSKLRGKKKNFNLSKTKSNLNEVKEKKNIIPPILDLENFLNVNSDVVKVISEKLDSLAKLYLKYSKINDKLAFNRMSFSAFLTFLKNAIILIGVPENMKKAYRKMGERLTQKNVNVSEIKTYNKNYKGSVPCQNVVLTEAEKIINKNISNS
jgi:glutaredoxin 2